MKALVFCVMLVILLGSAGGVVAHFGSAQPGRDPCDSYGNCVSASITYTRANPDDSLYPGDQFSITLQATPGSGGTGCGSNCSESWSGALSGVTWSYDTSALQMTSTGGGTSAQFASIANDTESQTVTAAASFLVTITTCVTTISSNTTSTTADRRRCSKHHASTTALRPPPVPPLTSRAN